MTTIAVVGEVVADAILPPDGIRNGSAQFTVHPGGGPANVAITLARLGTTARFGARLSSGVLGSLCKAHLEASGVDLSRAISAPQPATLAVANLRADGAAEYEFYVEGTADWQWTDDELAAVLDDGTAEAPVAVHTGSLALALQPSGAAIERLLDRARRTMTVSIDPNLRTTLVPAAAYRERIEAWARLSDIVRLSEDDLRLLWPDKAVPEAAAVLHRFGVTLAVISLGAQGAYASLRGEPVSVPVAGTEVVDTVGAGDSFHGGLLDYLARTGDLRNRLDDLTSARLHDALQFASRVAAITVSRPGADPPWHWELAASVGARL